MGRSADALRELVAVPGPPTTERLFYEAAARYERNAGDDRTLAIERIRQVIAAEPGERWVDAHALLVQWAVADGTQTSAKEMIDAGRLKAVSPLVYHTISGWLAASTAGREADATRAELRAAHTHLTDDARPEHVFLLAQLFASVGDDETALPLLLRVYRPGVFNPECRRLLDCAQGLHRHDVLVRVCRELRVAGVPDPRLIRTELETLQRYDPEQALWVAREHLAAQPDDRYVALWQSALALRLDRPELLIADLERLPPADELTPEGTGVVLNVLEAGGPSAAALRYAYDALRQHFNSEFAHGQFVHAFLRLSDGCPELRIGGIAGSGMAVCYREEGIEADRRAVLEDAGEPDLARYEFDPEHPLSRALAGRRVGETVVITDGGIQPRSATLREVCHKFIYRFRTCLDQFQVLFPGASAVQSVRVKQGDDYDFSPILKSLEDRRRHVDALDAGYRTGSLPLAAYAELSGRDEFEAWAHLAFTSGLGIRCSDGRADDLRAALEVVRRAKTLALDLTALHTLANLDRLDVLRSPGRSFVVAQTTLDRLRQLADRAADDRRSAGHLVPTPDGRLGHLPTTPEARERHAGLLASLRDAVLASCRIAPCPQAAELDPERREASVQVFGRATLDTMLLAAAPDTALWTDDLLVGVVGRADFHATRVWTQAVLFVLQQDGALPRPEYDRAVARLVGWQYHGVLWNADTVLAAAELAEWRTDRWPLPTVLGNFGRSEADPVERLRIAAEVIRAVWRREPSSFRRQGFLFALLTGLGSARLVQRLGRAVPALFSVDVFAADEVGDCIVYWLRQPTGLLRSG